MKAWLILLTVLISLIGISPNSEATNVDVGVSVSDKGLRGFYLSVGDYYRVPYREVVVIRERGIIYEEVPVVLFIAGRARVAPEVIVDLRLRGRTWMDIILHFGLSPEIFYVPVRAVPGPPYGKAYGYYKNKPKKEWKSIVLDDDDIVNLVNLRFISKHYGHNPDNIIQMRGKGKSFIDINHEIREVKKTKEKRHGERLSGKDNSKGKDKGKGKGKENKKNNKKDY
jgi:hypothetical protein